MFEMFNQLFIYCIFKLKCNEFLSNFLSINQKIFINRVKLKFNNLKPVLVFVEKKRITTK